MENQDSNNNNSINSHQLEYLNSFGAIFNDGILIHQYNESVPIHIDSLVKVGLSKKKKLIPNYIFLTLAIGFGGVYFLLDSLGLLAQISLLTLSVLFFTLFIFIKKYKYNFILMKSNESVEKIPLKRYFVVDAKQILKLANKKLEKKN